MTIFLRALWGPFGPHDDSGAEYDWKTEKAPGVMTLVGSSPARVIDWHFFGIREDNTMGRWVVRFEIKERKWKLITTPGMGHFPGMLNPSVHPDFIDAFVPDKPMIYGPTYLHTLKPLLRPSDIAYATRLAIEAAR